MPQSALHQTIKHGSLKDERSIGYIRVLSQLVSDIDYD